MRPRFPFLPAATVVFLLGCAAQPAPGPTSTAQGIAGGRCDAVAAQSAVGRTYTPQLAESARAAAGADTVRRLEPGMQVTLEFRDGRLNLDTDETGRVTRVRCG